MELEVEWRERHPAPLLRPGCLAQLKGKTLLALGRASDEDDLPRLDRVERAGADLARLVGVFGAEPTRPSSVNPCTGRNRAVSEALIRII